MVKTPRIIEPIKADLDDLAVSLLSSKKLSSPSKTIAGSPDNPLRLGDAEIDCYVLEDKTRVLSQRGMFKGLGVTRGGPRNVKEPSNTGAEIPRFASQKWLKPYINSELETALKSPIFFQPPTSHKGYGYPAEIIVDICDAILEADKMGATTERQAKIVDNAMGLVRSFAKVGIIALVDEATGYQDTRAKEALAEIFDKFLTDERQKWTRTFPIDFYKEIYRLRGWEFKPWTTKRPSVVANWTNNFIYDRLAPKITEELQRKNPKGENSRRKDKNFQWLSPEYGHPRLKEHLSGVIALLRASETWDKFLINLDRAYPKFGNTIEMPLTGGRNND